MRAWIWGWDWMRDIIERRRWREASGETASRVVQAASRWRRASRSALLVEVGLT